MEDRFKLRVYNNLLNYMADVIGVDYINNSITIILKEHDCPRDIHVSEGMLMQSTGIKDKNGKLIFEGDIVNFNLFDNKNLTLIDFTGKIIYKDSCYILEHDNDEILGLLPKKCMTIVGNIYQNPELVKHSQNHE